ncbi:hypothetical protein LINPERPRIM_LOCUS38218 [Linum perenne]
MMLRKWQIGIAPLDLTEKPVPVWVSLLNIPPQLITKEGISFISSQLGTPMNKFVRDGLTVKVCIVMALDKQEKSEISVVMGGERLLIKVQHPTFRKYNRNRVKSVTDQVWEVKEVQLGAPSMVNGMQGNDSEPSYEEEEPPTNIDIGSSNGPISSSGGGGKGTPVSEGKKVVGSGFQSVWLTATPPVSPTIGMSGTNVQHDGLICSDSDTEEDINIRSERDEVELLLRSPLKPTLYDYLSIGKEGKPAGRLNVVARRTRTRRN